MVIAMSRYHLKSSSPFITSVIRSFQAVGMQTTTQQTYIRWIREFIAFHDKRHPQTLSEKDVAQFITHIAVDKGLSYSSQNQALCALIHMYKYVIARPLGDLDNLLWAKKPKKLPIVYSKDEISRFLSYLSGDMLLMVKLALCSGLRISECCDLTICSLDFERGVIRVFSGKGNKDRETYMPAILEADLMVAVGVATLRFKQDKLRLVEAQYSSQPFILANDISHQALFTPEYYRWSRSLQKFGRFAYSRQHVRHNFQLALQAAGIGGKGSFHSLRHTFASYSFHHGMNIRELQIIMGHSSVETTEIYTHLLGGRKPVISPLDMQ